MTDDASKKKMMRARSLIQNKQYADARAILKQVNHPTAKKWLDKLDTIAPKESALLTLALVIINPLIAAIPAVLVGKLVYDYEMISNRQMCDMGFGCEDPSTYLLVSAALFVVMLVIVHRIVRRYRRRRGV